MARILYVGMRADYGDASRGVSFEERNFHHPLRHLPDVQVESFDFFEIGRQIGQEAMSEQLRRRVEQTRPELMFFVGFDDQHDPLRETVRWITEHTDTATMLWVCDDHWKFDDYSRPWAACLDWVVTTDPDAPARYAEAGLGDVVQLSQWAVNHRLYRPTFDARDIEVGFVGQPPSNRAEILQRVADAGIDVHVAGHGWGDDIPRLPFFEMLRFFSRTRINLNLSNSHVGSSQQIKGRNFEVPGCHAFLLTPRVPHLERYFEIDREIATFEDTEELVDKILFYRDNEDARRQVATRGYARCMREHTWERRLTELFTNVGLWRGSAKRGGRVSEVTS